MQHKVSTFSIPSWRIMLLDCISEAAWIFSFVVCELSADIFTAAAAPAFLSDVEPSTGFVSSADPEPSTGFTFVDSSLEETRVTVSATLKYKNKIVQTVAGHTGSSIKLWNGFLIEILSDIFARSGAASVFRIRIITYIFKIIKPCLSIFLFNAEPDIHKFVILAYAQRIMSIQ